MIPEIDVSALFGGPSPARDNTDKTIMEAAGSAGFLTITGIPGAALASDLRRRMLRVFTLTDAEKRPMLRQGFAPENPHVYRGWFPLQTGVATYKEGIDLGPDAVYGRSRVRVGDPLTEATPVPVPGRLLGWETAIATYYKAMEATGAALMRSVARGLDQPEDRFAAAFAQGLSTLRLIRYPVRPADSFGDIPDNFWVSHDGQRRYLLGAAHADSGFVTLLAQDGVEGLQAETRDGSWVTVPPREGALAVNFGKLLERWSGGRIRATIHRVIGHGAERYTVPFFYEPAVDAVIAPLAGGTEFAPFSYGDHLWEATTKFVEQKGIAHLRSPRGVKAG